MYVCICKGITAQQVQCALSEQGPCPHSLITALELDHNCCGRCAKNIEDLIHVTTEHSSLQYDQSPTENI